MRHAYLKIIILFFIKNIKINNIVKIFIFIFILISKSSLAQIKYDPIFNSTNTENRHLIEEILYTYSVSKYNKN